ncbi:NAD-dependent epimerase/dehydratase family protein [Negadavirga shengliensis]|uniref:NAD-dependent epimerase/dehydratase family protein n=1 Tax=Negadavirga shengliensis TaxID=1389218 RepID=A0ABV9T334_9BACT
MIKVGITGKNGFIGTHLFNALGLRENFECVPFERSFFLDQAKLKEFVRRCDVIVHLAALNRHDDPQVIYDTNVRLVKYLIKALEETQSLPHVLFASSTQEEKDNLYGLSKKEGRVLFEMWARKNKANFSGLLIPNVFGPFGEPYYNSVVATFCHQLTHGENPKIKVDGKLKLIYVGELITEMIKIMENPNNTPSFYEVPCTSISKVSDLLGQLEFYKFVYMEKGEIPSLYTNFELNLFNTFRCFLPHQETFPVKYIQHTDSRGAFVEIIRLGMGGQVSFSTTAPGITRGNHFHTRKIERFSVIKGKALIQLRRVGTDKVIEFTLNGEEPSYVDMPIWYTHNIKNIGEEELLTIFWINEFYDPKDPDTYFEVV